jgi:hypothetical protein
MKKFILPLFTAAITGIHANAQKFETAFTNKVNQTIR